MESLSKFKVGDTAQFTHVITQKDVDRFVDLTGDDNPLHVNRAFAEQTPFKGIVVHGMVGASFISTLIGKHLPGDGALWVSQNLSFLLPVRLGDELMIHGEIVKIHPAQALFTIKVEIQNQHRQTVLSGECQAKLLEMKAPQEIKVADVRKVALITGASRGIGAATALQLAKEGYAVAINYRSDKDGAMAVAEKIAAFDGQAMIVEADVSDAQAVLKMFGEVTRRFGPLTALVNNATTKIVATSFENSRWEDIEAHFNVQIKGAYHCIRAALESFVPRKHGAVVNIGTIYTDSVPPTKLLGYTSAKSALQTMTKSLAVEYGPMGIRFNTVSPGMTDTMLIADVPEKTRLLTAASTPLRRLAAVEDIAHTIAFLLDEKSKHITGQTIRVCGGAVME